MKKILLLSDLSREPDRQTIRGITRFMEKNGGWVPYHIPPFMRNDRTYIDDIVDRAKSLDVDAIFGSWPAVENGGKVDLDIPIVLKPGRTRVKGFSEFCSDSEAIGRMAAEFFDHLGLKNVSTSGMHGMVWSAEREYFFRKNAKGNCCRGIRFSYSQTDYEKVSSWLKKLPKPVGIFCCNDVNAGMLTEICIGSGIRIPEDVSILGVDDDEFLCNITFPSISSIKLDYEDAGYRIASKIAACADSGDGENFTIINKPVRIVERNSTLPRTVCDPYVRSVIEFMESHYCEGIGIKDAIASVPLSRRSIEIRFKKELGSITMLKYLTGIKVNRMKELLLSTDSAVLDIAIESGFTESENIFRIFRKIAGCTPIEFRNARGQNKR